MTVLLPVSIVEMPSIVKLVDMLARVPSAAGAGDARRQLREGGEAPVQDREVLDRLGRNRERSLAARRLNDRRFPLDRDRLGRAADADCQDPDRDTRSGADGHARPLERAERGHGDFNRVRVHGDVREHEVPGWTRDGRLRPRAAAFADQHDRSAWNDASLRIMDGSGYRTGGDLGRCRGRDPQERDQNQGTSSSNPSHSAIPPWYLDILQTASSSHRPTTGDS